MNLLTYLKGLFDDDSDDLYYDTNATEEGEEHGINRGDHNTLAEVVSPTSTLTTDLESTLNSKYLSRNSKSTSDATTMKTPPQSRRGVVPFLTPMTIKCPTTVDVPPIPPDILDQSEGSFETAKSSLHGEIAILSNNRSRHCCVSPLVNTDGRNDQTGKHNMGHKKQRKRPGTPEGLRPRNMVDIRSKLEIPEGLKPRASISDIRARLLGLDSNVEIVPRRQGRDIYQQSQSYQSEIRQHKAIGNKPPMNVSFASPEVTQPSMSSQNHLYTPTREIHLHKTVKKSNVSFTSSSLTDKSNSKISTSASPRISVDQAKTAVGLVVATSLNESSMLRDVSGFASSIRAGDTNEYGSDSYNNDRYINVEGYSFVPTDESKQKKSRSKIKSLGSSSAYDGDDDNDNYDHDHDEGMSFSYAAFEDSQSQIRPQRIDHSMYSSEDDDNEEANNLSPKSNDEWRHYELYKEQLQQKEDEKNVIKEDWAVYERYKREQEGNEQKKFFLHDQSRDTYTSRDHLFIQSDCAYHDQHPKKSAGYDFSRLTTEEEQSNSISKHDIHDPFLVQKGETSFISDISHSSATRSEFHNTTFNIMKRNESALSGPSNVLIQNEFQTNVADMLKNESALSGPSYHSKEELTDSDSFCQNRTQHQSDSGEDDKQHFGQSQLRSSFELKSPARNHRKEHMIIEIVRRLKDNLALVVDVEAILAPRIEALEEIYDPLIGTYTDKDGILTGYNDENRRAILSTLFRALMIVDERKDKSTSHTLNDYIEHSIHFFGSLVYCTPADDENIYLNPSWEPISTLQDAVDNGLIALSDTSLNNSKKNIIPYNPNIQSFGASTISTHEDISNTLVPSNIICHTIVIITTLLQKIAIELELLCQDPESVATSDYICRLYLQLMSIPNDNLQSVLHGFTFVSTATINQYVSRGTEMAHKNPLCDFDGEVKESNIIKNSLCWDLHFRQQLNYNQVVSSSMEERFHDNDLDTRDECQARTFGHFPTTIDVPKSKDA